MAFVQIRLEGTHQEGEVRRGCCTTRDIGNDGVDWGMREAVILAGGRVQFDLQMDKECALVEREST
jgi:hypothetical protein